jgi:hypothetical protein
MKKLLFFTLLIPVGLTAQDDDSTQHKPLIKIVSIVGLAGGEFYREGFEDRTVFQQNFPSSPLAFASLDGYSNAESYFYTGNYTNATTGMYVNMRLRGQKKYGEIRAGLSHSFTAVASQYYEKETETRTDTTQLSNGDLIYTDSVNNQAYEYLWENEMLTIDLAWIVRSDPRNLVNLYTGFGLSGGIGFNGTYEATYSNTSRNRFYNENGHLLYIDNHQANAVIRERYKAPVTGVFTAYVPIGANLRLSRKPGRFLSHIALVAEYQGGIQLLFISGSDTRVRTFSGFSGGLRWYVHAPKQMPRDVKRKRDRYRDDKTNID